jgi:hypothetical protein
VTGITTAGIPILGHLISPAKEESSGGMAGPGP